jgi:hypothetical protein
MQAWLRGDSECPPKSIKAVSIADDREAPVIRFVAIELAEPNGLVTEVTQQKAGMYSRIAGVIVLTPLNPCCDLR